MPSLDAERGYYRRVATAGNGPHGRWLDRGSPMTDNRAMHTQIIYDAHRKSAGIAYVLWLFFGGFSGHRWYAGKTGTAVLQLLMSLGGWFLVFGGAGISTAQGGEVAGASLATLGLIPLGLLGLWLFIDLFLIPGMIRERNMRLAASLSGTPTFY